MRVFALASVILLTLAACTARAGAPSAGAAPADSAAVETTVPDAQQDAVGPTDAASDLPEPQCVLEGDEGWRPDFVGLTEERATALAEERGLEVREVGRDGECFIITLDLRENRVNLEIVDGIVVGAALY